MSWLGVMTHGSLYVGPQARLLNMPMASTEEHALFILSGDYGGIPAIDQARNERVCLWEERTSSQRRGWSVGSPKHPRESTLPAEADPNQALGG